MNAIRSLVPDAHEQALELTCLYRLQAAEQLGFDQQGWIDFLNATPPPTPVHRVIDDLVDALAWGIYQARHCPEWKGEK